MKKQFAFILIIVFIFGLIPTHFSLAVTQTQLSSAVQIICPDNYGNWFQGTGTIIDPKGVILTNRHVVTDEHGGMIKACYIGFISSPDQEPDYGTPDNRNVAEVKYYSDVSDLDAAVLYLKNDSNRSFPSEDIWNSDSSKLQLGEKIEVVGFPAIGGNTITYTSGDFSGFGSSKDGTSNYIKSSVPIEHGNSGGAAYNAAGNFIGIPTMVIAGSLNSLSYILSVNSIKKWLSSILGQNYSVVVPQKQIVTEKPVTSIQADTKPPALKGFEITYQIVNDATTKQSSISYTIPIDKIIEDGSVKQLFYYFGTDPLADPVQKGKTILIQSDTLQLTIPESFVLNDLQDQYFIIKLQDASGNISDAITAPWDVGSLMETGRLNQIYQKENNLYKTTNNSVLNKYSGLFVTQNKTIWWVSPKEKTRFVVYEPKMTTEFFADNLFSWFGGNWGGYSMDTGILYSNYLKKPKSIRGQLLSVRKDDNSGITDQGCQNGCYLDPRNGKEYNFGSILDGDSKNGGKLLDVINSLAVNITRQDLNSIEPLGKNNYVTYGFQWSLNHDQLPLFGFSSTNSTVSESESGQGNPDKSNKLIGHILLQVESHGEAWYVNPADGKRYYMKDGDAAYQIMRSVGLGISDKDLMNIPIVNTPDEMKTTKSVCGTNQVINNSKGKILLQVNQHGEAWYVSPDKCKRIYLKDGSAAYSLMRFLGLGITNKDLENIPVV